MCVLYNFKFYDSLFESFLFFFYYKLWKKIDILDYFWNNWINEIKKMKIVFIGVYYFE